MSPSGMSSHLSHPGAEKAGDDALFFVTACPSVDACAAVGWAAHAEHRTGNRAQHVGLVVHGQVDCVRIVHIQCIGQGQCIRIDVLRHSQRESFFGIRVGDSGIVSHFLS